MSSIDQQNLVSLSPKRFTQVKRINNNAEVNTFYSDCKTRLCNVAQWNNMSLLNFGYKVSIHDTSGSLLNKVLEKGDYIKMVFNANLHGQRLCWFLVENVDSQKEMDSSEEVICITLTEIENPSPITNSSTIKSFKSTCELRLRRLINTISMDIKIVHQRAVDQSKSFLNHLRWEIFAKQILLQL